MLILPGLNLFFGLEAINLIRLNMSDAPIISLIFVNYNSRRLLQSALKGIFDHPPKISFQVIVVDNASTDDSLTVLPQLFPSIDFIASDQNLGFGSGANLGLQRAAGKYFAVLNPDLLFSGGEIDAVIAWMKQHPKAGLVSPKLLNPDKSLQYNALRFLGVIKTVLIRRSPLRHLAWAKRLNAWYRLEDFDHKSDRMVDWVIGAAMFIRAEAYARVGGFDSRYFMYYEDVDLCRRFWLAGFQVWYLSQVALIHFHFQDSQHPWYAMFKHPLARVHFISGLKYAWKWRFQALPQTNPESCLN